MVFCIFLGLSCPKSVGIVGKNARDSAHNTSPAVDLCENPGG